MLPSFLWMLPSFFLLKGSISRSDIDCRVSRSLTAQHRPSVFVFYFHFIFLPIFFCLFYFVCCPRPHPPSNPLEPEAETDQSASRERTGRRVGSIFLLISFSFCFAFFGRRRRAVEFDFLLRHLGGPAASTWAPPNRLPSFSFSFVFFFLYFNIYIFFSSNRLSPFDWGFLPGF